MIGNNANFDALKWKEGLLNEYRAKLKRMVKHEESRPTDGELERSLHVSISGPFNDPKRILISFALHGMFLDMGVGRGTKSGSQKSNAISRRLMGKQAGNKRFPKKWFNKTTAKYIYMAEDIISAQKGDLIIANVKETLIDKAGN